MKPLNLSSEPQGWLSYFVAALVVVIVVLLVLSAPSLDAVIGW